MYSVLFTVIVNSTHPICTTVNSQKGDSILIYPKVDTSEVQGTEYSACHRRMQNEKKGLEIR
jgi:hypothetical protein